MVKEEPKQRKKGKILLAEDSEITTFYAEVIAIGKSRIEDGPIICQVGDRIIYNKFVANQVEHDGIKYQFLRANEILAVVKEPNGNGLSGNGQL
jgi:co-chaperonin GroES (HSP10)